MQRGGTVVTTDICRLPYTQLPGGTTAGYSVVAFGHVGRFATTGGNDKYVTVGLRWDTSGSGIIAETLTRVPLHTAAYLDGAGANANVGHPWMVVFNVLAGTWPAATDLLVTATIEQVTAPSNPGSFWADATTMLAFQHLSGVGYLTGAGTNTLPFRDAGHFVIVDGLTMASAGRWLAFYSAQITPPTRQASDPIVPWWPYEAWLTKLDSGSVDTGFGVTGRAQLTGCSSRDIGIDIPPDPLIQLYSVGGWRPVDLASGGTSKLQIRGWTAFDAGSPTVPMLARRAISYGGALLYLREDAFTDALSDATEVVPSLINRNPFFTAQSRVGSIGDDRAEHFVIASSTLHDAVELTNKVSMTLLDVAGFPAAKFQSNGLHTAILDSSADYMPNFASYLCAVPPTVAQYPELPVSVLAPVSPFTGATADSGGSFSLISFTPTDDADRSPPVQRTMTYTAITLGGEIDATTLAQLTDDEMPSESLSLTAETGLVSFETDDGHVIRWPTWSKSRRAWRVTWLCSQARYQVLYAKLYRPDITVIVQMPPSWRDAPGAKVKVDQLSAEQVGSNLVWRISATLIELVYTP